jgi:hypothetical protein
MRFYGSHAVHRLSMHRSNLLTDHIFLPLSTARQAAFRLRAGTFRETEYHEESGRSQSPFEKRRIRAVKVPVSVSCSWVIPRAT